MIKLTLLRDRVYTTFSTTRGMKNNPRAARIVITLSQFININILSILLDLCFMIKFFMLNFILLKNIEINLSGFIMVNFSYFRSCIDNINVKWRCGSNKTLNNRIIIHNNSLFLLIYNITVHLPYDNVL